MKQYTLNHKLKEKAQWLALAGEPTRIRILCLLFEYPNACVHEIAEGVNASIALTSHHLQAMKGSGLLDSTRHGQTMCYQIKKNEFTKKLKKIICE